MTTAKRTALDAFISHKLAIDDLLQRLQELSEDHFEEHPDEINWGHVGDVARIREKLQDVVDAAFQEGEYAQ
jgi:hypothetical protein